MATADTLRLSHLSTREVLLLSGVTMAVTLIVVPHILGMATSDDSIFKFLESDDTNYPLPGECQVLWTRVEEAQGRFNEALSNGWNETTARRFEEMTAAELEYKQKCDPSFKLTRDTYFPH